MSHDTYTYVAGDIGDIDKTATRKNTLTSMKQLPVLGVIETPPHLQHDMCLQYFAIYCLTYPLTLNVTNTIFCYKPPYFRATNSKLKSTLFH